jgi:hypothetical protein
VILISVGVRTIRADFDSNEYHSRSHHSSGPNKVRRVSEVSDVSSVLSPGSVCSPMSDQGLVSMSHSNGVATQSVSHRQQQHQRNRQKNRLAAAKCRERTKNHTDDLRRRERELSAKKRFLTACAAELKGEVLALKHEILKHGDCDCEYIKKYISAAAGQIA